MMKKLDILTKTKSAALNLKSQANRRALPQKQNLIKNKATDIESFNNRWQRKQYFLRKWKKRFKHKQTIRYFFRSVKVYRDSNRDKWGVKKIKKKVVKWVNKQKYAHKLNIRVKPNNIFCTLTCLKTKKCLLFSSAGTLHVRVSKRLLRRYALNRILQIFIKKTQYKLNSKGLIVFLIAPIRTKKRIIKILFPLLRKYKCKKQVGNKIYVVRGYRALLIKGVAKKIFNGCKARKLRRKKKKFGVLRK